MVILFLDKYSIRRYLIRGKTPAAAAALYTRREEIRSHQTAQKLRHLCWSKLWLYVLNTHAPIHAAPLNIYCCDVLGKYTTLSYYIHSIPDTPNSSKSALSRRAASIVYRVEATNTAAAAAARTKLWMSKVLSYTFLVCWLSLSV